MNNVKKTALFLKDGFPYFNLFCFFLGRNLKKKWNCFVIVWLERVQKGEISFPIWQNLVCIFFTKYLVFSHFPHEVQRTQFRNLVAPGPVGNSRWKTAHRHSSSWQEMIKLDRIIIIQLHNIWILVKSCNNFIDVPWGFIFVFHEEHRNYHKYPEYWVQMWKSYKQRYWYHLRIECNCVENDETVNISWLVKDVLTICWLLTARLFWNIVTRYETTIERIYPQFVRSTSSPPSRRPCPAAWTETGRTRGVTKMAT